MQIVNDNCSVCEVGEPLSSGVYGPPSERVRWAMWTCGHMWTSTDDVSERSRASIFLRRLSINGGLRRHAPLLHRT